MPCNRLLTESGGPFRADRRQARAGQSNKESWTMKLVANAMKDERLVPSSAKRKHCGARDSRRSLCGAMDHGRGIRVHDCPPRRHQRTRMRSPSGRVARASRTAPWSVGSTRGKPSPGTENDQGSPPDCFQIRACMSFGSTLSAHAVIRVARSMKVHSDQVELASRRQECGVARGHRGQDVQPLGPSKRPSDRTPRARSPIAAVHNASPGFAKQIARNWGKSAIMACRMSTKVLLDR
jgi:hypothetical protein